MADEKEKKKKEVPVLLIDKVNSAIEKGELDPKLAHHYRDIAEELDGYTKKVDKYSKDLAEKLGSKHKTPQELYLTLIKQVAVEEGIKNADKIKSVDDINDRKIISKKDIDNIRRHLAANYGIPDEEELKKLLDTVAGDEYESEEEVREAIKGLAHQKGQHEFGKTASPWASAKEWPKHTGAEGSHTKFMDLVVNYYRPEAGKAEIDTYKTPEQAVKTIGSMAEQAYETAKKKRRKV